LNKKQTTPDGGEGDKDQLTLTFPNCWQTINQLRKKQTAPDGGEGDKDPHPDIPNWETINQFNKKKPHLMAEKGIRTNSSRRSQISKLSINSIKNKQHLMAEKAIRINSSTFPTGKISIN
jgi:hypothetical protein